MVGLVAAFLLGNLRDPVQAAVGLAFVVGGPVAVVYMIPEHSTAELIFIPLEFAISWVAGFALRERASRPRRRKNGRARRSGSGTRRRASQWPRSVSGSRGNSTTSSPTP